MEFVYSNNDGVVAWGPGSSIRMQVDDIWWADDAFVLDRPDLFSTTPIKPHSSAGRDYPPATPVEPVKRRGKRG